MIESAGVWLFAERMFCCSQNAWALEINTTHPLVGQDAQYFGGYFGPMALYLLTEHCDASIFRQTDLHARMF